jgi:hypothetical protein
MNNSSKKENKTNKARDRERKGDRRNAQIDKEREII